MKFFLAIFLILFSVSLKASNYYFSASIGNDSRTINQAQNPSTPWKTIDKLNSFFTNIKPGDSILFKKGETYEGTISVTKSGVANNPIVISSYGIGSQPIITGYRQMTNWISLGSGIWESTNGSLGSTLNNVLFNGNIQQMGRYPNIDAPGSGYLTLKTHTGTTQITDNELSATPVWTGGEVVIRKERWILDRNIISSHVGNTINYVNSSRYEPKDFFGYFIQNHPQTLDQLGEWYYDKNQHKLQLYFANNNPSSYDIKASFFNSLVLLDSQAYIKFYGLTFQGANISTIDLINAANVEIKNCNISYSGGNGISVSNSKNLLISDNAIEYCYNNGIDITQNSSNAIIRNNQIKDIGTLPGMGRSDDNNYNGINVNPHSWTTYPYITSGKNNLVEYNTILNIGYIPINFGGDSVTIKNNFINYFCFVKDDGGGIYTFNKDPDSTIVSKERYVISNIVLYGAGAGDGTNDPYTPEAHGIYMDDWTNNVQITSNTVAFNAYFGIHVHNASNLLVQKNTAFNNYYSQMLINQDVSDPRGLVRNNVFKKNLYFSKELTEDIAYFTTLKNDITSFGTFDSNYYCRPLNDNFNILTAYNDTVTNTYYNKNFFDLEGWQTTYRKDSATRKSPVSIQPYRLNSFIGGNKFSNGNFDANIVGTSCSSINNSCNVSWSNGALNGGSLRYSFTSLSNPKNKSLLLLNIGDVSSVKNYILKFSLKGTKRNQSLGLNLRRSSNNDDHLTYVRYVKLDTTRTENELLFSYPSDESNATLVFEVEEQDSTFWIDNLQLLEANVSMTNPGDSIRFEYNASTTVKSISLNGTYVDMQNKKYSGTINLDPYASIVLVAKPVCNTSKWLGTSDNSWHNPLNWSCGIIPDANTNVTVGQGTLFDCTINSPAECGTLTVSPGGKLKANKALTIAY